jgi:PKD repeat protein
MKSLQLIASILTIGIIFMTSVLQGQSEMPDRKSQKQITNQSEEVTGLSNSIINEEPLNKNGNYFLSGKYSSCSGNRDTLDDIDTLNYPLAGTPAIYTAETGGYVTGNNAFGDLAKANYYETEQDCQLMGVLFDFYDATCGSCDIEIAVWDNNGTDNSPGTKIGSNTIPLNTIINDITNQQMTYVEFSPPIIITTSFYVGAMLPTTTGDTLVIWSNTDGDTNPGIAWEQWENGDWYPISSMSAWGLNLSQAIFPIVKLPLMADFSVSDTNIQPGDTITFTDESTGNPTAWEWSFEGGEPAVSSGQNPEVAYSEEGTYDVSLIISNDTISDTLTISDYITVSSSNITIDTLNYPLQGTYAVYGTSENGFVSGNNEFGDLAKANYFSNNQEYDITGILIEFAYTTGGNPDIEIAVWDDDGSLPGNKLGNNTIPLNTITNNVINEELSYVSFNPPINVTSSFFAGFMLPTVVGDTLVVWSNMDGETMPGIAWEQWDNGDWYPFNSPDSWEQNVALAIFPVVQNALDIGENHINDRINIFPNPSDGIYYFSLNKQSSEQTFIEVNNTSGICVYKNILINSPGINSFDLSNHPAGLYFFMLEYKNEVYFQKIIKK